jgi:hypothetical protein
MFRRSGRSRYVQSSWAICGPGAALGGQARDQMRLAGALCAHEVTFLREKATIAVSNCM